MEAGDVWLIVILLFLVVVGNARVRLDFPKNREERLVAGDRFYWDQILFNLIENVLKHNRARGVRATVRLDRSDGRQRLVVEDDGIGIASKDLPFVFDRFYRADSPRAGVAKGTGLGLSIVRRAVEAHGGEIAVESAPGVRTRFTILFQI